ncbi:MAG: hypothetical protein P9L96_02535 [Candidatus Gygaella obscura]|nr:hypothetical protein [Candidatus Gygaella obscura]
MKRKNKAQTIIEYAVFVAFLVAAVIAIQVYFKRGVQGRIRQTADEIGSQYDPENTISNWQTTRISTSSSMYGVEQPAEWSESYAGRQYYTTTTIDSKETVSRSGEEQIIGY